MVTDVLDLTKADNQGAVYNGGRASYSRPVPLWDNVTGELASFTSNFTFQIRPINETVYRYCNITGDGMAFFLAQYPSSIPVRSFGQNLGLFNDSNHFNATGDSRVVAVEFDTYENVDWDLSQYHVGIDVNSIVSTAYTNVSENLASNQSIVTAEVSYNNLTGVLSALVRINDDERYNVSAPVDMKASLPEEVSVGFSGGTGRCLELNQVHSWSFSSTLKSKDPAMAPDQFEREELERGVAAGGPRRYAYRELAAATSGFAEEEKLGRGGFGSVYRGDLAVGGGGEGRRAVAIKMFSTESSSAQGRKEFEAEVTIISRLKHRNLVQLIGWCDSRKGLLLVYELVTEGSLDKHLYSRDRLLSWSERYHIILGLGSALRYLHGEWEQCVVHGDLKPSNIMLDASLSTKLGDFGLARLVDHGARWTTTHAVLGTAGYIDPEFVNTRRPSTESDVYSFGIVLLEIASGRPPATDTPDGFFVLLKWVWNLYGRSSVLDAVDPRLRDGDGGEEDEQGELWRQMERVLVVGLWCAHPDRSERPSVAQAMHVLQSDDVGQLPALPRQMYRTVSALAVTGHAYGAQSSSDTTDGTPLSSE
ncbi:L-type lectin-domain containing receptor kinase IX.1-like [Oryza brachyantha]|uniref:L-type lectin-domain containing receptor kinase IX.1-like n=1 Tax=Oryza brachyantha TaxID=4533 RepID=UPI001ADD4F89|nr:L-type lectin-domain containing receptor kinase IX.1-like [Oryza brachyantha]